MKITKTQLRKIIKEELDTVLVQEYGAGGAIADLGRNTGIFKGIQKMKGNSGEQLLKDENILSVAVAHLWHTSKEISMSLEKGPDPAYEKKAEKALKKRLEHAISVLDDARAKVEAGIYKVPGSNTGSLWYASQNMIEVARGIYDTEGLQGMAKWANDDEIIKFMDQSGMGVGMDRPNRLPGT
jgi:hypothetical protein